jgi:hypothetical protein
MTRHREVTLESAYRDRGVVLVLGAGVSRGSGIPTWLELIERLAVRQYGERGRTLVGELLRSGHTLAAIASILEDASGHRELFTDRIRDALYEDFPFYKKGLDSDAREQLVEHVHTRNPTLRAVAAFCTKPASGAGLYVPNPRVRAVVNFNLDAILRAYLRARYHTGILRTIERPSAGSSRRRTHMYHMHGFLVFHREGIRDLQEEAPDARVFTEQEYFDFFNSPNALFNYTFLYLLREHPCVFIGMSMRDDNIRRMLHYSVSERRLSFEREGRANVEENRTIRHYAILPSSASAEADELAARALLRLGVRPVWITHFAEIPAQLQTIYESVGDKWSPVWRRE